VLLASCTAAPAEWALPRPSDRPNAEDFTRTEELLATQLAKVTKEFPA
jgi:hypothetical protein